MSSNATIPHDDTLRRPRPLPKQFRAATYHGQPVRVRRSAIPLRRRYQGRLINFSALHNSRKGLLLLAPHLTEEQVRRTFACFGLIPAGLAGKGARRG